MKDTSYIYIDEKGFVTYAMDVDSPSNRRFTDWTRYIMPTKNVIPFMRYWGLKFHPLTRKNSK